MTKKKFLKLTLIFVLMISCGKSNPTETQKQNFENGELIQYEIKFPSVVSLNQPNYGEIHFKSPLDTIIEKFGDKKLNRYTRFIAHKTKDVKYNFDELKRNVRDTFGARNNRLIPLYNIRFDQVGIYYLDGIINDIILIDTIPNSDEFKIISNEERVTIKVTVKENTL